MQWGNVAEWATAIIAFGAVVLTVYSLWRNRRAVQRSDLVRIHERLMSEDLQRGRRLLADAHAQGLSLVRIRRRRPHEWDQMNLAVSAFQMLAELVRNRVIRKQDAIELWGGSLRRAWARTEPFIASRRTLDGHEAAWGDLVWFAVESGARVSIGERGGPATQRELLRAEKRRARFERRRS